MSKAKASASLLVLATAIAVVCLWLDYLRFVRMPLNLTQPQRIEVPQGTSQTALVRSWASQGWLAHGQRDQLWLRAHNRIETGARDLKLGEYELRPGQTLLDALRMIRAGEVINYRLTIIEGWNYAQLRAALREQPRLKQLTAEWSDSELMQALDKPGVHPEGQFLPETYTYTAGISDLDLLRQASQALDDVLQQAWSARSEDLPLETPLQLLTLASIIEKETALSAERRLIAGVFTNRLHQGMRLQTDPTVIYGLGSSFDGNLRRRDLRNDTPYNTYTRHGLPPTPIALPGRASIHAAASPQTTDKLYFVATGQGGEHHFSATLQEHNAAVRRYQIRR